MRQVKRSITVTQTREQDLSGNTVWVVIQYAIY